MSPPDDFQDSADSAGAAFSTSDEPGADVLPCGAAAGRRSYAPCDIDRLTVELNDGKTAHTVVVDRSRTGEPKPAKAPKHLAEQLSYHDVVLEAVASTENTVTSGSKVAPDTGAIQLGIRCGVEGARTCGREEHPRAAIRGPGGKTGAAYGPVELKAWAPGPEGVAANSRWGRLWPFGEDRRQVYSLTGEACGQRASGEPIGVLAAAVVVMPDEQWKITFGAGARFAGSASAARTSQTAAKIDGETRGVTVYTRSKTVGGTTTTSAQGYAGEMHYAESFAVSGQTASGFATTGSRTLSESDSTWGAPESKDETSTAMRKIKIERTTGGRKSEVEVDKIFEMVMKLPELASDLNKLFDGIPKVGWSISTSFTLLSGEVSFGWGVGWPESYPEQERIHYCERSIEIAGSCKLVEAKVEVFFGVEVDPWYLDVAFWAKLYLEVTAGLTLSATAKVVYTNPADKRLAAKPVDLGAKAELKAECGGKIGGRAFGYSLSGRIALESDLVFDCKGQVSFDKPPSVKGSLTSKGAQVVGEVIAEGRTRKKHEMKPLVLMKNKDIFKDKVFM